MIKPRAHLSLLLLKQDIRDLERALPHSSGLRFLDLQTALKSARAELVEMEASWFAGRAILKGAA